MPWDEGLVNSLVYDRPDPVEGRVLEYAQAISEALALALEQRPARLRARPGRGRSVRDVRHDAQVLQERFGSRRVFDTPLSEEAMMGVSTGAAMNGLRPVLHAQPSGLRPARLQSAGEPRREISFHGQRPDDRAARRVGRDRTRLGLRRTALAGHPRHAARRAGAEDCHAVDAPRREGPAAVGHRRQQPGVRLRAPVADEEGRRRPGGSLRGADWPRRVPPARGRRHDRRRVARHRARRAGRRRACRTRGSKPR